MREGAARGCALAILLDIEIIEKVMYRPELMDLKLDVSYVQVLFGSEESVLFVMSRLFCIYRALIQPPGLSTVLSENF